MEIEYYIDKDGILLPKPASSIVAPIVKQFLEGNGKMLNLEIEYYMKKPISWEKLGLYG